MGIDRKQKTFLDIKDKLKKSALRSFDIPDYGQVDNNLVNMANFFPLIKDIIISLRPRIISEIGSDQGMTSDLLYEYCKEYGAKLHVVDPAIKDDRQSNDIVTYYQEMSISYLQKAKPADIYFIDGDHNYFTVINELRLIRDKNADDTSKLLFLHDVGWPWGCIDMYYDESTVDRQYRKKTTHGLNLSVFRSSYVTSRQGLSMNEFMVATKEGGKANGVSVAVKDFLKESPGWMYFSIPSIYGLGVLWYGKGVTKKIIQRIDRLAEDFRRYSSFLSILEFNRILLLEKLQEAGELWAEQKAYIEAQDARMDELSAERKALEEQIAGQGKAWAEQKAYIEAQDARMDELSAERKALEEQIAGQGRAWAEQKAYIGELIKRNVNLDLRVMELETLWGWLKRKFRRNV